MECQYRSFYASDSRIFRQVGPYTELTRSGGLIRWGKERGQAMADEKVFRIFAGKIKEILRETAWIQISCRKLGCGLAVLFF